MNNVAFSHNHGNKLGSNYFVTVHHRRVQYWYYDTTGKDGKVQTRLVKHELLILCLVHVHVTPIELFVAIFWNKCMYIFLWRY